ncbi:MAG TPA: non-canonical purine NTP pyrophosphatase, RdgB/HAM1 family, partial [Desulfobulbaceae bacterium]|nr:non-canonical purine NTP pyrophosphatase, RdgB/HAM1 family [Desulfobulbaceae bacterium]
TRNAGKLREIRAILSLPGLSLLSLRDFPDMPRTEETGASFAENAMLKARAAAYHTGLPALADDSGLEVDALDGRPGILSARYAGPGSGDRDNLAKLLGDMSGVPEEKRTARFVCQAALVYRGRAYQAEGQLEGIIIRVPKGGGGFGYDPVFLLFDRGLTLAELEPAEKNRISHRAQALRKLEPMIRLLVK